MSDDQQDAATVAFLIEAGHLKRTPRSGWFIAGIKDPESVAEHSFRTAVIAYVLATMEGCDPERAAALALFHDLAEVRTGDVPSIGKPFVKVAPDVDVVATQTAGLPTTLAERIGSFVAAFADKTTPEARCAKDADKLEALLQAREYEAQGNRLVQPWVDTMLTAVQTDSGKRLAEAAVKAPVDDWWHDIVASYGRQP